MPAGVVLAAMAGLWIAYLVPHWLRHRQYLLESRTDDRFSEQLRVIRVARVRRVDRSAEPRAEVKVALHPARGGGRPMDRPHATADRVSADAARRRAAAHAQRAAAQATRVARARRRAALAIVLVVLSAAGWGAVGVVEATIAAGAVPSGLLLGVLVLGRRAAVAGQRQAQRQPGDRDLAGAAPAVIPPAQGRRTKRKTVGRAVRASDAVTEVLARVAESEQSASLPERTAPAAPEAPEVGGWVPVPVPAPAYTLKPAVRRAEPPPLLLDERAAVLASDAPADRGAPDVAAAQDEAALRTGALDLDAVLARRRASGE